jgi:hypothetical protein
VRSPRRLILVAAPVLLTAAAALAAVIATLLSSSDTRDTTAVGEEITGDERPGLNLESELRTATVASCGRGTFTMHFSPEGAVVVRKADNVVARGSVTVRDITCGSPIRKITRTADGYPWQGDLADVTYEATVVTCHTEVPLEIAVYPTIDARGAPTGSVLLVAHRTTKRIIASAVLLEPDPTASPGTSRVYTDSGTCTRT